MSLQTTEFLRIVEPFPANKNVRVLISGLALCKFNVNTSNVRFLRHVAHHDLIMNVLKIRMSDMAQIPEPPIILRKNQNVRISGSTSTAPGSIQHNTNLRFLIGMRTLHNGHQIGDKADPNLPTDRPSSLSLLHCTFYTHQRTSDSFRFTDCGATEIKPPENYCEVLGGYMNYSSELVIDVDHEPNSPFRYSASGFKYQITFTNHCNGAPACTHLNDFEFNYHILEDKHTPSLKYCLEGPIRMARRGKRLLPTPDTAACLPVCEDC